MKVSNTTYNVKVKYKNPKVSERCNAVNRKLANVINMNLNKVR